jgi:hypothetical protein
MYVPVGDTAAQFRYDALTFVLTLSKTQMPVPNNLTWKTSVASGWNESTILTRPSCDVMTTVDADRRGMVFKKLGPVEKGMFDRVLSCRIS